MERRQRAQAVVARCLELDESRWSEAIAAACAEAPDLADDIRAIFLALRDAGIVRPARARFIGGFELLGPLGEGGMGDVFRARDVKLGREVAVKLVRSDVRMHADAIERFEREMRTIAGLSHPGIVKLLSSGVEDGIPYYAMELIDGLTLAEVLRRFRGCDATRLRGSDLEQVLQGAPGRFPGGWVETCFRLIAKLARALDHAHRHDVLHRDIKPGNIMLTRAGEPIVIDFGLAKQEGDVRLTRSGAKLGSLPYLAPELWTSPRGQNARTEVYSLGLVLWELLTLRAAFEGQNEEDLRRTILGGELPRLRALQPALSRDAEVVCTCAADVDSNRRHADCGAFAEDLDSVLALRPIAARTRGRIGKLMLAARRRPAAALVLLLLVLTVTLGTTLQVIRTSAKRAEQDFAMRDRRQDAKSALDALTFLQGVGDRYLWPIRPSSKPRYEFAGLQAKQVLDYLLDAHARGEVEKHRFLRPMPALQPAENGGMFFVPQDMELDRDHSAFLTERSATIAIRTMQLAAENGRRLFDIADSIERVFQSEESKIAWQEAARSVESSGSYPGLRLRPKMGLMPIGTDRVTGRLLFWLVGSGARPDLDGRPDLDPDAGVVLELMPACDGVARPYLLSRHPMSNALWARIGYGVPRELHRDPGPVTKVSLNDCRVVLPRLALRLPTQAEWRARYLSAGRPHGIVEWVLAGEPGAEHAVLVPEEDSLAKERSAGRDLTRTSLVHDEIGVRAACDPGGGEEETVAERVFVATHFGGWTCGATGGGDSGAAWILRDKEGLPDACIETVTFSGHAFLICLHPEAIWDPAKDGAWTDLDFAIDCKRLTDYGLGEVVMPVVQQGDVVYFGYDRGLVTGRIDGWHLVGVNDYTPTDFNQLVPRDWDRDKTYLTRGDRLGPEQGPGAKPMRFGFGVYGRDRGVYRQLFDNFRLTVRRRE